MHDETMGSKHSADGRLRPVLQRGGAPKRRFAPGSPGVSWAVTVVRRY
jgi:hypothetical protein